ncbi:GGDEF domain-containing protein [Nocardioides mangrovicus]|uniref:GGDEF domain-containing protein n=1 Tax=Nocardioides mangrovicus TaxID=2478913 RepID=A0A3L8P2B2_9ACTN|nr:GGDEF domain-containing protein [Nocardioides mangrovicus]RLV48548.1 GGDEF domain-containing protein [Nocardioides mangrovicus]
MSARTRALLLALVLPVPAMWLLAGSGRDLLQAGVELSAMTMVGCHLVRRPDLRHAGLLLVAGGVWLTLLGDVYAFVAADFFGAPRDTEVRNGLIVTGYVLLAWGAFLLARRATRAAGRGGWVEAAIFGLGGAAPVMVFLVLPGLQGAIHGSATATVAVYGAALVLLVTVLARFSISESLDATSLVCFGVCGLITLAADFTAALHGAHGRDVVAARALWMLAYVSFAAAVVHPSLRIMLDGEAPTGEYLNPRRRLLLLTTGLLVPSVSLTIGLATGDTDQLWLIAGVAVAVSALVARRMYALVAYIGEQADRLAALARSDELTGLPNRRSWNHELPRACDAAFLAGRPLAVAVLDLDGFKDYNDRYGHQRGDALLRESAAAWSAALAPGEYLARYGGEEFTLFLAGLDAERAADRVEQLRRLVPAPTTASAGVAAWSPGDDPLAVVAAADAALYRAKAYGRDRTVSAALVDTVDTVDSCGTVESTGVPRLAEPA